MPPEAAPSPLPKAYEFHDVEPRWSAAWQEARIFEARMEPGRPAFSMVIPPPNVTGVLHIGHALNNTLQDILVRYKRMDGYNTVWIPGTDHAGIATQNVVERQLAEEGLTRHDLGRERFIERVWQWKARSGGTIIEQLKRLGCSCDWSRERFTMDEGLSRAVREVFVRLYEEGLVYKGDYIINWCPRCHTALADIEVEHEPAEGRLWHIRYPLADGEGHVVVATTRPETLLGDTAVAVHPDDARYRHIVGRRVRLPLLDRLIPVIADPAVDPAFGTGAVKVTPAHDFNDFEMGRRHDLPSVTVLDEDARTTEAAGPYRGLDRYEARRRVLEDLAAAGLLEKEEPHAHAVGGCYRCKTVVEPYLSKQWFVRVGPLAERALRAVREGRTRIVPPSWERTYEEWMTNIRDWCISRQIWWGHRIPAWTCQGCGKVVVARETPERCPSCGGELAQETDVLDTWFSSALWPFSTLGWPDRTPELEVFYPTSVLVTSFDILFFWVARMMMMGLHFMGEVPFRTVYLHALVRDAEGQKMSKSKGNVIDPLTIMERYGTDAVRFTLAAFAAQGRDIKLAEDRIEGYRHFVNKVWNAARLVLANLDGTHPGEPGAAEDLPGLPERWILSRLDAVTREVRSALDAFDFDVAARTLYQFFWHEFCDWYLELAKPAFSGAEPERTASARAAALAVLDRSLRLLHPFMPFVTEELWHHLPGDRGFAAEAPYPEARPEWHDPEAEARIERLQAVVTGIRNARAELGIHPGARIQVLAAPHSETMEALLADQAGAVRALARVERLERLAGGAERPTGAATVILEDVELFIPLEGLVDVGEELRKLDKETAKLERELEKTRAKLANENFLSRAPAEVVAKEREKVTRFEARLAKIAVHRERLAALSG
ncbi:valine--tRNA ligase [Dissulfurirhabdus thermomarina]|uniref:Valine--tRNA ligase n=1 Tax=Dissulfurirhabdus thermomarina TaxID=1765737 RepID=A0A6N9TMS9_DISTH|nr:valine--tRNA ligase [Dissulfurirhabdus thermomarina]NDY42591.1 valine--tRNA ligase [Dissulfurirhabdus thermomarina]NMX24481.1 valine--tRNA ligase [Dissulfurirhabdus thermomarina]